MRSQTERDAQTVTIATSLSIFVTVLAAGALVGLGIDVVGDLSGRASKVLTVAAVTLGAGLALAYLARHRRS